MVQTTVSRLAQSICQLHDALVHFEKKIGAPEPQNGLETAPPSALITEQTKQGEPVADLSLPVLEAKIPPLVQQQYPLRPETVLNTKTFGSHSAQSEERLTRKNITSEYIPVEKPLTSLPAQTLAGIPKRPLMHRLVSSQHTSHMLGGRSSNKNPKQVLANLTSKTGAVTSSKKPCVPRKALPPKKRR